LTTLDSELLSRAREYDAQALAEIYGRYAEPVYRYLYRYLGDAVQAEDLTSEVFVKLLQVLGTQRAPRDNLQGWLYRVAHNQAMDWFRHQGRNSTEPLEEQIPAQNGSPSVLLEEHQARQHLRSALRQLTQDQQQVILLRFGEGLRITEVGRLMGKSEGAVKILQHRAVKRLRRLLDEEK
jgi:RNA polymerase sigma-70 factor (ECF subfamily)